MIDLIRRAARSRSSARSSPARRRGPLRPPPRRLLDGHRHPGALSAGELGHPRGHGRDGARGDRRPVSWPRAPRSRRSRPSARRAVVRSGSRVAGGAVVSESVLLDGCTVGADAEIFGSILARRVEVGDGATVSAGSVIGERARVEAGRRGRRRGARRARRGGRAGGGGVIALEQIRALDPSGQLDDVLALPDHLRDALWRVESAGLEPAEARGLIVCGMGGSAIGGVLARAAMGDGLNLTMLDLPRLRAAAVDGARPRRPLLELLRRHRGDPRLLRGRRGGRRAPLRGHHRRRARRGRAQGRGAGDRPAGRAAAATRRRLRVHRRLRDRGADRRRAGDADGDRRCGRAPGGAPGRARRPRGRDRRAARRHRAADLRLRSHRPGRLPVEVRDQRERQAARVRAPAARARPQRDRRLDPGGDRRRSPPSSSPTATSIRASASAPSSPRS